MSLTLQCSVQFFFGGIVHERGVTFRSFALEWIELNKVQWTNQKHYLQWLSRLETYCFPIIGEKPY